MAYYQKYTCAPSGNIIDTFLQDLEAFATTNGWTTDFNGIYGTYRRLHIHKNGVHFDFQGAQPLGGGFYGCTGYSAGVAAVSQPGVSAAKNFTIVSNGGYEFVSTPTAIYMACRALDVTDYGWGGIWTSVQNKIGVWTEGFGCTSMQASTWSFGSTAFSSAQGSLQLYYNGGWSASAPANGAGGIRGITLTTNLAADDQPNFYNAGILPFPVPLFRVHPTDVTKVEPMGYFPDLFFANAGDLYMGEDVLTIGGDSYLILSGHNGTVGLSSYADLLFKVGA